MKSKLKKNSILVVLSFDLLILIGVFYLAHLIRFEFMLPTGFRSTHSVILLAVVFFKIAVFELKLYKKSREKSSRLVITYRSF